MAEYTTMSMPAELRSRVAQTFEVTSFTSTIELVCFSLPTVVMPPRPNGTITEEGLSEAPVQLFDRRGTGVELVGLDAEPPVETLE